jgi:hypothetical protein
MKLFEKVFGTDLAKAVWEKLDETVRSQINEKVGDKELMVADDHMIPKHRLDEEIRKVKELSRQVEDKDKQMTEINGQLETFKKAADGNADLQKKVGELQTAIKDGDVKHKEALKALRVDAAIELELSKQTDFPDLLSGKVDRLKLQVLDDGSVHGLDEQINVLKEDERYKTLFGKKTLKGKTPDEGKGSEAKSKLEKEYESAIDLYGRTSPQAIAVKMRMNRDMQSRGEPEKTE